VLDLLNFVPDPRAVSISEDRRGLGVIYLRTADSGQRNGYVNGVKRCTVQYPNADFTMNGWSFTLAFLVSMP